MCHPDSDASLLGDASGIHERDYQIARADAQLPVFATAPAGPSRGNVIIIHDIHGANAFYHDLARRCAQAGFAAYLPELFVRQGPLDEQRGETARERGAQLPSSQAVADLQGVIDDIAAGSGDKIGVVGFCMGGTLTMLLSTREPRLAGGVIYYGFPANEHKTDLRPWAPLEETADVLWPLLGFWGDQDRGVGMDNVARYDAGLTAADKPHDFTIYPGLPHAFLSFDPASPYHAESEQSWNRTLTFFDQQLG